MALVGEKINKTHLCSEALHDAKKVCTLQWMLMNIDLCLIFEMKNLISKLGVSLITMSITLKTSFFLLNRRSKKNASWSNKNASRYLYKINVIGLAENKILINIALRGRRLYYTVFKSFEGRILLDLPSRTLLNLAAVSRMAKRAPYPVHMVFASGHFSVSS